MDERIRDLFVKRMGLILDKRKNDAAGAATRVRREANKHGMLHSSRTDLGVKSAYLEVYDEICGDAWSRDGEPIGPGASCANARKGADLRGGSGGGGRENGARGGAWNRRVPDVAKARLGRSGPLAPAAH